MASSNQSKLAQTLSIIAGVPVEITVRGERKFTFSFDEINPTATSKLVNYFGTQAHLTVELDEECGTFIYAEV